MRPLVLLCCVLLGLTVGECICDPIYRFSTVNVIKHARLLRKFESAGDASGVQIVRIDRGWTVAVCRPRNIEALDKFRCLLRGKHENSPWLHVFGVAEAGDEAAKIVVLKDTPTEYAEQILGASSWAELLDEITNVVPCYDD